MAVIFSLTPIGVIVKLLPNDGAAEDVVDLFVSVPEFAVFASSDLADGMTVTEVSLRFGTIELFEDNNDLTSFIKEECEEATLLELVALLKVILVASPVDCWDAFSMDFLLSFDFLRLPSCLKYVIKGDGHVIDVNKVAIPTFYRIPLVTLQFSSNHQAIFLRHVLSGNDLQNRQWSLDEV